MKTCTIEGCGSRHEARGYCVKHYNRLRKHGSTADPRPTQAQRFWAKVQQGEGCWEWLAGKNAYGYGRIQFGTLRDPDIQFAHRVAYEYVKGPIPEEKFVDHICGNRGCVNPGHLRIVTSKQNSENLQGAFSTSKSGVRGVCWDPRRKLWRATVTHNARQHSAGHFGTIEEAEAAVIALRLQLFTHNNADRQQQRKAA